MTKPIFKVQITYPNKKSELIEEDFAASNEAYECGNSLLAQIVETEKFHGGDEDAP